MRRWLRRDFGAGAVAFTCALAVAGSGCPTAAEKKSPSPTGATCARIGQSCEFARGKLGTCVQRDDCTGNDCFVCQSQH